MRVVLATSKTCGPCHVLKSKLKKENLTVETLEFEDNIDFFKEHQIKAVPKLLIFEGDELTDTIQGIEDIFSKIKETSL